MEQLSWEAHVSSKRVAVAAILALARHTTLKKLQFDSNQQCIMDLLLGVFVHSSLGAMYDL